MGTRNLFLIVFIFFAYSFQGNCEVEVGERLPPQKLNEVRLKRFSESYEVQKSHNLFKEQVGIIINAEPIATADKIVPYEECVTFFRKRGIGKMGNVDMAETICRNRDVTQNQAGLLGKRKQLNEMLAVKERSGRLINILSELINNWKQSRKDLSQPFQKKCGLDEACLEKKQEARYHQIHSTATTRLNLFHIRNLIPLTVTADPEVRDSLLKSTNKVIEKTEEDLIHIADQLSKRVDLPW